MPKKVAQTSSRFRNAIWLTRAPNWLSPFGPFIVAHENWFYYYHTHTLPKMQINFVKKIKWI